MLKNISNLGQTLNQEQQQAINGGGSGDCYFPPVCHGLVFNCECVGD